MVFMIVEKKKKKSTCTSGGNNCRQSELCECRGGRPVGFCGRKATLHHHQKRTYTSLQASVAVKQNVYLLRIVLRAQELCENPGGLLGLPSLISLWFLWT